MKLCLAVALVSVTSGRVSYGCPDRGDDDDDDDNGTDVVGGWRNPHHKQAARLMRMETG
jgi:hypothetical protein